MTSFSGFEEAAEELGDFAALLETAGDNMEIAVDAASGKTAVAILFAAVQLVPVDEGDLKESLDVEKTSNGRYLVGTDLDYAKDVETGRGPVFAQNADALHFFVDGEEVFATSVGPAEAQPFLRPALRSEHQKFLDRIEDEVVEQFENAQREHG
jgi:hypothetical protein